MAKRSSFARLGWLPFRLLVGVVFALGVISAGRATTVTYSNGVTDTNAYSTSAPFAPLLLEITSGSAQQSGTVSGTGSASKEGAGTLTLSASNSYSGGTILNAGTLRGVDIDSFGSGTITINGGTLGNEAPDASLFLENNLTINSDFSIDAQGAAGVVEIHGSVDLGAAATRTITLTSEGLACFGGVISGQNLTFLASGSLAQAEFCDELSNTFTGTLRVGSGVTLGLSRVLDAIAVSGNLQIDQGATVSLWGFEQFAPTSNVEVNGVLGALSGGTNSINTLSGTGTIEGVNGDTLAIKSGTFTGAMTDNLALLKTGSGTLALTGSNTYNGGTTIVSGVLRAQNNHALGDGNVMISGSTAVLSVESGVALDIGSGHGIILQNDGASSYLKNYASAENLAQFNAVTSSGSNATVAQILGGTASAARSVVAIFEETPSTPASNDILRISDVLSLSGLGGETFVLQLNYTQSAFDAAVLAGLFTSENELRLGWLTGGAWVPVANGLFVSGTWNGSMVLGTYGVDAATNVVWAVTDHNSEFAVVPEPSAYALVGLGVLLLLFMEKQRRVHGCAPSRIRDRPKLPGRSDRMN